MRRKSTGAVFKAAHPVSEALRKKLVAFSPTGGRVACDRSENVKNSRRGFGGKRVSGRDGVYLLFMKSKLDLSSTVKRATS